MPHRGHHHALTARRERATLLTLGAVQFTHILDFMIMMPLGAQLMDVFVLTVLLAAELRAAAPHVSAPAPREPTQVVRADPVV